MVLNHYTNFRFGIEHCTVHAAGENPEPRIAYLGNSTPRATNDPTTCATTCTSIEGERELKVGVQPVLWRRKVVPISKLQAPEDPQISRTIRSLPTGEPLNLGQMLEQSDLLRCVPLCLEIIPCVLECMWR